MLGQQGVKNFRRKYKGIKAKIYKKIIKLKTS
jgi:hypothetical protein